MERRLRASETRWPPAIRSRAAISFWDIGTGVFTHQRSVGDHPHRVATLTTTKHGV